eukprot:TRINITY_DN3642_c0_g1_i1.p1 TRINITY_DN3642_c0_g1~~TRINITY_DN3642_c0_g1_i1.p1  ORF type:complete len:399 (+),score=107.79 TRINITY_DN3642_c0_g1_i1:164-1360(+)
MSSRKRQRKAPPPPRPRTPTLTPEDAMKLVVIPAATATAGSSCFLCLKAKAVCDRKCPCSRCSMMNVPHMCLSLDTINRRLAASSGQASEKLDPTFILRELEQMKKEQRRLQEEVTALRKHNLHLADVLGQPGTAPTTPTADTPTPVSTPAPSPGASLASPSTLDPEGRHRQLVDWSKYVLSTSEQLSPDQAMLIFDLTAYPPLVLNASRKFFDLLGFAPEELLGATLHKILHPEFAPRTTMLQRRNPSMPVEMEQLYLCKDGTVFRAMDTHRIFANLEGQPLLDVVSVRKPTVSFLSPPPVCTVGPCTLALPLPSPPPPPPQQAPLVLLTPPLEGLAQPPPPISLCSQLQPSPQQLCAPPSPTYATPYAFTFGDSGLGTAPACPKDFLFDDVSRLFA